MILSIGLVDFIINCFNFLTNNHFYKKFFLILNEVSDDKVVSLKAAYPTILLVCFLSLKGSTCKTWKNTFYFTLKVLVIHEKIKC